MLRSSTRTVQRAADRMQSHTWYRHGVSVSRKTYIEPNAIIGIRNDWVDRVTVWLLVNVFWSLFSASLCVSGIDSKVNRMSELTAQCTKPVSKRAYRTASDSVPRRGLESKRV